MANEKNVFGERSEALRRLRAPWKDRPSIYRHLARHLHPEVPGLLPGAEDLPDEKPKGPGIKIKFSPGLHEGIGMHGNVESEAVEEIATPLKIAASRPPTRSLASLYKALTRHEAIAYVDPLLEWLGNDPEVDPEGMRALAVWLAMEAPDREPVKLAMALLGVFGLAEHIEVLQVLGRHDEFTLYAAVAFR